MSLKILSALFFLLPVFPAPEISYWVTSPDQSMLLQKQAGLSFGTAANGHSFVDVDASRTYQSMDGFGYTLTGGSAYVINKMGAAEKSSLLKELFGKEDNAISISYLRISIGASDLDDTVFSYDDLPGGQTDPELKHFSLKPDKAGLIPLLKEILRINPAIKILGSPWSPPAWMKDNGKTKGGSLKKEFYPVYANYFVKYIQQMRAEGIKIDAITPQNEPLHPGNNPSLLMVATDQAEFIRDHLGPAFKKAGIKTKIILYDHNCDRPDYPLTVLKDPAAKAYVHGSAFHLYAGDISALTEVHNAHPDKHLYFTEQYTASSGKFEGDLRWHIKNLIIGAPRNWSRTVLEWNLANDPSFGPHTPGGCTTCKGALTIDGSAVTRNVAYYIIAHASKFVPAGSVRIESTAFGDLYSVAFKTPAGKKVLIVLNDGKNKASFNIRYNKKWAEASLDAGAVASFVWN
jgi:glucosylceramidase